MFGEQFYPTPPEVVRLMVDGLELKNKRVLDPQAGRGDILDYVKKTTKALWRGEYYDADLELYAMEKDADLRAVLKEKGYKVVDSDFLRYTGQMYFHFFLMNPPFAEGAKHLLKAWEVSNGALIRCLLNAETLRSLHTQERQILSKLIETHGSVRNLGQPFLKADRPTDVEVVLVELQDTRQKESFRLDFDPTTVGSKSFHLGDIEANELASSNIFENYEGSHRAALAAFKELLEARQKVAYYLTGLLSEYKHPQEIMSDAVKEKEPDLAYDKFLSTTTAEAWDVMFTKTKLGRVTTEQVRRQIEQMQADQGKMSFTAANMEDLFDMLFLNREKIMIDCILEAFDMLTKHYHENREAVEGWKTNGAYLVGKKFILPYVCDDFDAKWGHCRMSYDAQRRVADLEKALCFISGRKFEGIFHVYDAYSSYGGRVAARFGEWQGSTFFETILYKKGTMHFKWNDDELRKRFNQIVARERWGELPEEVKDGTYGPIRNGRKRPVDQTQKSFF